MRKKGYSRLSSGGLDDLREGNSIVPIPVKKLMLALMLVTTSISLSGCLGFIIGSAVDVGVAVAKVPFKATKAAVDVITDDDGDKKDKKK